MRQNDHRNSVIVLEIYLYIFKTNIVKLISLIEICKKTYFQIKIPLRFNIVKLITLIEIYKKTYFWTKIPLRLSYDKVMRQNDHQNSVIVLEIYLYIFKDVFCSNMTFSKLIL